MCVKAENPEFEDDCRCRAASLRAYRGMIESGAAEPAAMGAAFKVYRFYHPTDMFCMAHLTVERWIYGGANALSDDRLPTSLWLDAQLRRLAQEGVFYTIIHKGAFASGTVMLKLFTAGQAKVQQQQRDADGKMGWLALFEGQAVDEAKADDFIRRAVSRDPDIWVIEIEDRDFANPFEGSVF